jgi:hypothetical protein
MSRTATAVVRQAGNVRSLESLEARRPAPAASAVEALRQRLAAGTAREHVVLDFLEDDLREARAALAGVAAFLANVEGALGDETPSPERLSSLARSVDPAERVEYLQSVLASMRRRLWQVAARM